MIMPMSKLKQVVLLSVVVVTIIGSMIRVTSQSEMGVVGISLEHPFGFSPYGHDLLLLCLSALAKTAMKAAGTAALTLGLGMGLGLVAAYKHRQFADFTIRSLGRLLDGLGPLLVAACLLSAMPRVGSGVLAVLLALVSWPVVTSVVRAEVLAMQRVAYVEAAVVVGVRRWRMSTSYLLPAIAERLVPLVFALFASFAGVFGALAFLGLGTGNENGLGFLIYDSQGYLRSKPMYFLVTFTAFLSLLLAAAYLGGSRSTSSRRLFSGDEKQSRIWPTE